MKSLWIMHPQKFYPGVVQSLAESGIHVSYICADPQRLETFKLTPDCVKHAFWDAMDGLPPPGMRDSVGAPDPAIIDQLAPYESVVLQMFERFNYVRLSIPDLRRIYFRYVALWTFLLKQVPADAVVFHNLPHHGFDYVLYQICRLWAIRTLIFERTYLPDRMILIEAIEEMPNPPFRGGGMRRTINSSGAEPAAPNYYDARNRQFEDKRRRRLTKVDLVGDSLQRLLLFLLQVGRRPHTMLEPYRPSMYGLGPKTPTRLEFLWRSALDAIYLFRLRDFYESKTVDPDSSTKYIYYPLQFQPERTSIPMGLTFADQLLALNMLADCLPEGWRIYVKEHPRQFTDNAVRATLGRSKEFYKTLVQIRPDRVRLVSVNASSKALLRGSQCVATVAGTAGWEAVQAGVPAIVFGAPWYMNCPGVFQVKSNAECQAVMRNIQSGDKVDAGQVEAFSDWIRNEASFPGYMVDVFEKVSSISAEENARSYASALASRLAVNLVSV